MFHVSLPSFSHAHGFSLEKQTLLVLKGLFGSGNGERKTNDKTRVSHQNGFKKCQEVLCFIKTCTVSQSYPKKLKKLPSVANPLRRFPLKAIVSVSNHLLLFQFHTPLCSRREGLKEIEEIDEIDKEIKEIQRSLQKKCCAIFGLRWSHIILQKGSKMAATL